MIASAMASGTATFVTATRMTTATGATPAMTAPTGTASTWTTGTAGAAAKTAAGAPPMRATGVEPAAGMAATAIAAAAIGTMEGRRPARPPALSAPTATTATAPAITVGKPRAAAIMRAPVTAEHEARQRQAHHGAIGLQRPRPAIVIVKDLDAVGRRPPPIGAIGDVAPAPAGFAPENIDRRARRQRSDDGIVRRRPRENVGPADNDPGRGQGGGRHAAQRQYRQDGLQTMFHPGRGSMMRWSLNDRRVGRLRANEKPAATRIAGVSPLLPPTPPSLAPPLPPGAVCKSRIAMVK